MCIVTKNLFHFHKWKSQLSPHLWVKDIESRERWRTNGGFVCQKFRFTEQIVLFHRNITQEKGKMHDAFVPSLISGGNIPTMPSIDLIQLTRICCELAPGLLLTSSKHFISSSRHEGLRVNGSRHT